MDNITRNIFTPRVTIYLKNYYFKKYIQIHDMLLFIL